MCDASLDMSVAPHDTGESDVHLECDEALLEQLASGSATVDDVASALASGWDPNSAEPETGDTPLHLAARSGSLGICQALVAAGANPLARCVTQSHPRACTHLMASETRSSALHHTATA